MAFNPGMSCQGITTVTEWTKGNETHIVDTICFGLRWCHFAFDVVDKKRCKKRVDEKRRGFIV
jgi:hypothetical protein